MTDLKELKREIYYAKIEEMKLLSKDVIDICCSGDVRKISDSKLKKRIRTLYELGSAITQCFESDDLIRGDSRQRYIVNQKDYYMGSFRGLNEFLQYKNQYKDIDDTNLVTLSDAELLQDYFGWLSNQIHKEGNHWKMKKNIAIRSIEEEIGENPTLKDVEVELENRNITLSKLKRRDQKSQFLQDQPEDLIDDVYESLFIH